LELQLLLLLLVGAAWTRPQSPDVFSSAVAAASTAANAATVTAAVSAATAAALLLLLNKLLLLPPPPPLLLPLLLLLLLLVVGCSTPCIGLHGQMSAGDSAEKRALELRYEQAMQPPPRLPPPLQRHPLVMWPCRLAVAGACCLYGVRRHYCCSMSSLPRPATQPRTNANANANANARVVYVVFT
jgi:hypothetical protein